MVPQDLAHDHQYNVRLPVQRHVFENEEKLFRWATYVMNFVHPMLAIWDARLYMKQVGERETHAAFRAAMLLTMVRHISGDALYIPPPLGD